MASPTDDVVRQMRLAADVLEQAKDAIEAPPHGRFDHVLLAMGARDALVELRIGMGVMAAQIDSSLPEPYRTDV